MIIKVITSVAVEKNGKFLIVKRNQDETMPGLWEFPGGKLNPDETLENCAIRELLEESGLEATKIEYRGYTERFVEDRGFKSSCHTLAHHFYVSKFKGEVRLSEEHQDFKWITKEEIFKMKVGKEIGTDTIQFFNLKS